MKPNNPMRRKSDNELHKLPARHFDKQSKHEQNYTIAQLREMRIELKRLNDLDRDSRKAIDEKRQELSNLAHDHPERDVKYYEIGHHESVLGKTKEDKQKLGKRLDALLKLIIREPKK